MRLERGYIPKNATFTNERAERAWQLWQDTADKTQYQRDVDALTRLNRMGEKGAVEVLYALGLFPLDTAG